jgi:hypothetical protein
MTWAIKMRFGDFIAKKESWIIFMKAGNLWLAEMADRGWVT